MAQTKIILRFIGLLFKRLVWRFVKGVFFHIFSNCLPGLSLKEPHKVVGF